MDMKKYRDALQGLVNACDEMIELEKKEKEGKDISREAEAVLGRFVIKAMELKAIEDEVESIC